MSYCTWCGRELGQDEFFCKNCGTQAAPSREPASCAGGQPASLCADEPNIGAKGVAGEAESSGTGSPVKATKYGLLGYRSHRAWKMVIASLWYAFWLLLYLLLMTGPSFECSQADLLTYRLSQTLLLLPFVLVPILLSSFKAYEKLPGKNGGRLLRIIGAVLCAFILFAESSSVSNGFSQEYQDNRAAYEISKQAEYDSKAAEQAVGKDEEINATEGEPAANPK